MPKKVLIIEDNAVEAKHAQEELAKAGIKYSKAVSTLSEGLEAMPNYDALLSDLFFPAGSVSTEQYVKKFLPLYEQFAQRIIGAEATVLRAVKQVATTFGMTPRDYVDKVMSHLKPEFIYHEAKEAIENQERYERFLKTVDDIKNGKNLPLGIIATERATQLGLPSAIVTSINHHDYAFESVRDQVKVPYRDTLVNNKKDWKGGIELLSERSYR